jgi:uncharacterized protein YyaL (SSP411 family)
VNLISKVIRRALWESKRYSEKVRLAPVYSPDPANLDLESHLSAALDWLKRAQDTGDDRGVSWGVKFGSDFEPSYPETTGYICQTFVQMARRTGDREFLERAVRMGDWEVEVQMPEGAVMGGMFNRNPTPAIFNTGMVLLGWSELIRATGEERFKTATCRAADWLVRMQDPDGNWRRGNSQFANATATTYNVKAAWGLCEAGVALDREDYVWSALRNAEFCVTRQKSNGWFRDCCLEDPAQPLLHTIAYTMQGLLEIGRLTARSDLIAAAQRTAEAELALLAADGFLPGQQDAQMRGTVTWCCLTGSAQTSIVWRALHSMTGEKRYREAADLTNRYLLARHDIRNSDARLRGGLPGSWPVHGPYGRLRILNWATKFLADALASQKYQGSGA